MPHLLVCSVGHRQEMPFGIYNGTDLVHLEDLYCSCGAPMQVVLPDGLDDQVEDDDE